MNTTTTTYRPFRSKPSVKVVSPVDVYKIAAALSIVVATKGWTEPARRRHTLALVAHSLAGVRRGSESAEAWAARAQKQINDIARNITT